MNRNNSKTNETLSSTMGSSTGEVEYSTVAGGWAGTDDATSTAPSDLLGTPPPPEDEKPYHAIARDFDESIQVDEETQQELAEEAEEASERVDLLEKAKRDECHRLAEKVRAARELKH